MANKDAFTQRSRVSKSSGDETGSIKGMGSAYIRDNMKFKSSSSKVKVQGSPIRVIPPEETLASRAVEKNAGSVGKQGCPVPDHLANQINRNLGQGSPLPGAKQAQMESIFGAEFSDVRLHTDQEADALNHQLSARAFTIGNDIFFNHKANPHDDALLTHELTHVVQQRSMTLDGPLTVGPSDDLLERQAESNSASQSAYQTKSVLPRDI